MKSPRIHRCTRDAFCLAVFPVAHWNHLHILYSVVRSGREKRVRARQRVREKMGARRLDVWMDRFCIHYNQIILQKIPLISNSVNSFSRARSPIPTPRPAIKHSLSESKNGEPSMQQTNNNFVIFFRRIYWYCYLFAAITARCLHVLSAQNTSFWLRIHLIWLFFFYTWHWIKKMHFGCLFVCLHVYYNNFFFGSSFIHSMCNTSPFRRSFFKKNLRSFVIATRKGFTIRLSGW